MRKVRAGRVLRWGGVVAVCLGVLGPAAGARARSDAARFVSCSDADQRITLTASAVLDPGCTYTGGFDIAASHVSLDCAGALIQRGAGGGSAGVRIATPVDVDMD